MSQCISLQEDNEIIPNGNNPLLLNLKDIKKEKQNKHKQALFCLCFTNFLLNAAVSVITPFYPPLAKEVGMSVLQISCVFSINPVGSFIFSFFIGQKMAVWGRKRCIIIGNVDISQVITIVMFGLLQMLEDSYSLFFAVSLMTRFLQGMSRAAYSAISFAYVPILWPDSIQQKISIMESLTGLGLMAGPFFGAILFKYFEYQATFYIMGGLFSMTLIPTFIYLPEDYQDIKKILSLKAANIIKDTKIILLSLVIMMTSAGTTFISPTFTLHMKTYDIEQYQSSLILGSLTVTYVIFILFVPSLCKVLDKKIVIFMGAIFATIGDLVIAPINGLPNKWWMVLVALPIIGSANAFCVLPAIPLYIEYMSKKYPQMEHRRTLCDISSALFVSSYSLGILVGPLLGGQVYELFKKDDINSIQSQQRSFKYSAIVMAGIQIIIGFSFFIFGGGINVLFRKTPKVVIEEQQDKEEQEDNRSLIYSDQVYSDVDNRYYTILFIFIVQLIIREHLNSINEIMKNLLIIQTRILQILISIYKD